MATTECGKEIEVKTVIAKDDFEKFFKIKGTYTIRNGVYDVEGDVLLLRNVKILPFKFGLVTGNFWCGYNELTSLEGAPVEVRGSFYCNDNNLVSLEGAPTKVGGDFWCSDNTKSFTKEDVKEVSKVKKLIF